MSEDVIVVGAYGRDYTSESKAREDWDNNKDFQIISMSNTGRYINKQDAEKYNVTVKLRYAKLTKSFYLR